MNWRITDCISKKQGSRVAPSPSGKWYWLAGICLLFVVVIGGVLWYAHPQPLEKVIPVLTQENMNCDVSLYCGDTEGEYKGTLTKAQLETLLTYFDGETLKRSIFKKTDAATEQRSTVSDGTTRLYFWQNNTNERYELLLLRDCVIVGDLSHNQRETYSFSGGQTKQDDLFWYLYTIIAPESKKQTITSIRVDFDGDGDNDVVRVCASKAVRRFHLGLGRKPLSLHIGMGAGWAIRCKNCIEWWKWLCLYHKSNHFYDTRSTGQPIGCGRFAHNIQWGSRES